MAKPPADNSPIDPSALKHSPFAKLARPAKPAPQSPGMQRPPAQAVRAQVAPPPKLSLHAESRGRSGKAVTRIAGLPPDLLAPVAAGLRKALGCTAEVEGEYVVLFGSLKERATEWFNKIGDVRKLAQEKPAAAAHASQAASPPAPTPKVVATSASGTRRKDVRPGMRVAIVLKADQPSGELTEGVVRDLLTSSAEHPHGIKVRLVSGQVGRVKIIYE
jgi:uncharacterized repeat protein (TIGR03833 family)